MRWVALSSTLLMLAIGCAESPSGGESDAAPEVAPEASHPMQPTGPLFFCGNLECYIEAQYCSVTDYPGMPPPPPTFLCVPFDAGPTCGPYPLAPQPGSCGCWISDAGAFTITECLK